MLFETEKSKKVSADIGMGKSQRYQAAVDGHYAALDHWKKF